MSLEVVRCWRVKVLEIVDVIWILVSNFFISKCALWKAVILLVENQYFLVFNPYPTAFPYGNGMVLHFYQQQESSTTKTVHKVINKGLKAYV